MDERDKTIDEKSMGEVGALLHDCIVQPLTNELETRLAQTSEKEDEKLGAIAKELQAVGSATRLLESQVRKTGRDEKASLDDARNEILRELDHGGQRTVDAIADVRAVVAADHAEEAKVLEELKEGGQKTTEAITGIGTAVAANYAKESKALDDLEKGLESTIRTNTGTLETLLKDGQRKEEGSFQQLTQGQSKATEALQKAQETLEKDLTDQSQSICNEIRKGFSDTDAKMEQEKTEVLQKLEAILAQLQEGTATSSNQLTACWERSQTALETYKKDAEDAAAEKYKKLLGVSLSFGIVNFLGIVALLVMNFMH